LSLTGNDLSKGLAAPAPVTHHIEDPENVMLFSKLTEANERPAQISDAKSRISLGMIRSKPPMDVREHFRGVPEVDLSLRLEDAIRTFGTRREGEAIPNESKPSADADRYAQTLIQAMSGFSPPVAASTLLRESGFGHVQLVLAANVL
jgi:hypothetical protein